MSTLLLIAIASFLVHSNQAACLAPPHASSWQGKTLPSKLSFVPPFLEAPPRPSLRSGTYSSPSGSNLHSLSKFRPGTLSFNMCQESVQTAPAIDINAEIIQQLPQAEGFVEVNRSIPSPVLDNLHVKGSDLRWGDNLIFQGMSQDFVFDNSDTRGLFLSVRSVAPKNLHFVSLGKLVCDKFLALSRMKLWWMNPSWGSKSEEIPPETQFLLLRLSKPDSKEEKYALVLPIISGAFRSCIVSGRNKGIISLRVESGDSKVDSNLVQDIAFVAIGKNPYDLIHQSMAAASDRMNTFKLRKEKSFPASLDSFGWCTWDAFYSSVDGPGILQGVEALAAGGTPARTLIIDDGWQDTTFVEEDDHLPMVVDELKAEKK